MIARIRFAVSLEELITVVMAFLYGAASAAAAFRGGAILPAALNIGIILSITGVATLSRLGQAPWIRFIRDWYVLAFLIAMYLENRVLIPLINPRVYDGLILSVDRMLFFGHDPTALMERIMHPGLTEVFQLVYASFYFLPLSLCILLYRSHDKTAFHVAASTILMGFYLSYMGYYVMPVAGPRYHVALQHARPLEGVFLFDTVRSMLDAAEGMMYDCMPSGHTLVSVLTTLLAIRYRKGFFAPLAAVWSAVLVFSTVYLRYHYVVDLLAGGLLGIVVYMWGPAVAGRYLAGSREDIAAAPSMEPGA